MNVLNFTNDPVESFSESLFSRLVVEPANENGAVSVGALGILIIVRSPYIQQSIHTFKQAVVVSKDEDV